MRFVELGFAIAATSGTAEYLEAHGVPVETVVAKVGEDGGGRAVIDAVELIRSGKVQLVVNTPRVAGPGRRRPHPPGRQRPPGGVPHDGGRGQGGGGGHRRLGRPPLSVRSLQEYQPTASSSSRYDRAPASSWDGSR